ncbi:signal peptidase II [Candidatus Woesearchaeota archaeon]|nr:signal peptidase II [Candidatus Woesearchaeota archaeon]
MRKKLFILTAFIILIDQLTKFFFQHKNTTLIKELLYFKYSENQGLIFGFFSNNVFFIYLLPILVLAFLLYYMRKMPSKEQLFLTLIIAGIFSNLIGRIIYGYVIDFLYIPIYPRFNMANFNLADTSIVIGVFSLLLVSLKKK